MTAIQGGRVLHVADFISKVHATEFVAELAGVVLGAADLYLIALLMMYRADIDSTPYAEFSVPATETTNDAT